MPAPTNITSPNGHVAAIPTQTSAAPANPMAPASQTPPPEEKKPSRWGQILLTLLGWVAASVLSAEGAWNFFTYTLHMPIMLRVAAFALYEVAVLACAVRARTVRILAAKLAQRSFGGVAGIAVWVFAALSGVFSASHETIRWGQGARFVAPLIAAFLFELLIAAEAGDAAGKVRKKINLRFTPERIMIRLGLADPSDRTAGDVARDRAISRLATLAARDHAAVKSKPDGWRAKRTHRAYHRHLEAVNERFGLAGNPKLMEQWRVSLALLHGARDMTSPEAVANINPWNRPGRSAAATSAAAQTSRATATGRVSAPQPVRVRRTPDEVAVEYSQLMQAQPEMTFVDAARQLGYTGDQPDRGLRAALDKARPSVP